MDQYKLEPKAQSNENKSRWEDSAELIVKFYKLYDDYTTEHADKPYKKAKFLLAENAETMKRIDK